MLLNPRTSPRSRKAIAANTEAVTDTDKDFAPQRDQFLAQALTARGRQALVDRILTHGCREDGGALRVEKWFVDYLSLLCDLRLKKTATSGASQISKTLAHTLLATALLEYGRIPLGWFYSGRDMRDAMQPEQFQPVARLWQERLSVSSERESVGRWRIPGATISFSYPTGGGGSSGLASQGGAAESFPAFLLFLEEFSQYGARFDPSPRLGASLLRSKPLRLLGTPGKGRGIEEVFKSAAHRFSPCLVCNECGEVVSIEPKGALLRPVDGVYFSPRGEILRWFAREDGSPYIGCEHCEADLTSRVAAGECVMGDPKTGVTAMGFLERLEDEEIFEKTIAIYLSPLVKISYQPGILAELIADGIEPQNPDIYQQNKLGYASEAMKGGILIEQVQGAIGLPFGRDEPFVTVAGIDQGLWIWIERVYAKGRREVMLADFCTSRDIPMLLTKYGVQKALIDNEPQVELARKICLASGGIVELADQVSQLDNLVRKTMVNDGRSLPVWRLNNRVYQERVVGGFQRGEYRLVGKMHKQAERHLTSITVDPNTENFVKPADDQDHLFYAALFAQAAGDVAIRSGGI